MEILIKLDTPATSVAAAPVAAPEFDRAAANDAGSAPADLLAALGQAPTGAGADQQNAGEPAADLLGALSNGQATNSTASDGGLAPVF